MKRYSKKMSPAIKVGLAVLFLVLSILATTKFTKADDDALNRYLNAPAATTEQRIQNLEKRVVECCQVRGGKCAMPGKAPKDKPAKRPPKKAPSAGAQIRETADRVEIIINNSNLSLPEKLELQRLADQGQLAIVRGTPADLQKILDGLDAWKNGIEKKVAGALNAVAANSDALKDHIKATAGAPKAEEGPKVIHQVGTEAIAYFAPQHEGPGLYGTAAELFYHLKKNDFGFFLSGGIGSLLDDAKFLGSLRLGFDCEVRRWLVLGVNVGGVYDFMYPTEHLAIFAGPVVRFKIDFSKKADANAFVIDLLASLAYHQWNVPGEEVIDGHRFSSHDKREELTFLGGAGMGFIFY